MIQLILYFTIYSFFGWALEVVSCSMMQKKLVGRGFLFGPVCPIYGAGALLIIWATSLTPNNLGLIFLISMVICTILEYLVGYLMERIFSVRWWDYSTTDRIHLHGRVCLRNSLFFGIFGCFLVYYIHPSIVTTVEALGPNWQTGLAIGISALYLFDTIASSYAANQVKKIINTKKITGDQTNEIKKVCRAVYTKMVKLYRNNRHIKKLKKERIKFRKKMQKQKLRFENKLRRQQKRFDKKSKKFKKRLQKKLEKYQEKKR